VRCSGLDPAAGSAAARENGSGSDISSSEVEASPLPRPAAAAAFTGVAREELAPEEAPAQPVAARTRSSPSRPAPPAAPAAAAPAAAAAAPADGQSRPVRLRTPEELAKKRSRDFSLPLGCPDSMWPSAEAALSEINRWASDYKKPGGGWGVTFAKGVYPGNSARGPQRPLCCDQHLKKSCGWKGTLEETTAGWMWYSFTVHDCEKTPIRSRSSCRHLRPLLRLRRCCSSKPPTRRRHPRWRAPSHRRCCRSRRCRLPQRCHRRRRRCCRWLLRLQLLLPLLLRQQMTIWTTSFCLCDLRLRLAPCKRFRQDPRRLWRALWPQSASAATCLKRCDQAARRHRRWECQPQSPRAGGPSRRATSRIGRDDACCWQRLDDLYCNRGSLSGYALRLKLAEFVDDNNAAQPTAPSINPARLRQPGIARSQAAARDCA